LSEHDKRAFPVCRPHRFESFAICLSASVHDDQFRDSLGNTQCWAGCVRPLLRIATASRPALRWQDSSLRDQICKPARGVLDRWKANYASPNVSAGPDLPDNEAKWCCYCNQYASSPDARLHLVPTSNHRPDNATTIVIDGSAIDKPFHTFAGPQAFQEKLKFPWHTRIERESNYQSRGFGLIGYLPGWKPWCEQRRRYCDRRREIHTMPNWNYCVCHFIVPRSSCE
jgi:hypothetical protein